MDANLLRFNYHQKYLVFDFETCNVNLIHNNFPWQLAFLLCEGFDIKESHNFYIKWPNLPISKDAARITRFNREEYDSLSQDPKQVLSFFEKYLYNPEYRIIVHNGIAFDTYVHTFYRKQLGKPPDYSYLERLIDTDSLARAIKKGVKLNSGDNLLAFLYKTHTIIEKGLKTNLTALGKELKIDYDYANLHRADKDIPLNWLVWTKWVIFNIDI